ncbi:CU044_5270 family protein [Galbitalea sp. SE-J8]|uniref:CU044_5270 family protein n=1 Tax=Galbitalea sp. SE-J8 TaxID=3054952 RepID=UPI00259D2280|nr:CU044_5270 family protein [Galbitalea sp. SE-J8]MDM4764402.1 CU044_5270 family protein [Galbitalea sp. SE-J8]
MADLDDLIRRADPYANRRDAPLSARARADLRRILRGQSTDGASSPRQRRPMITLATVAAALCTLVVALIASGVLSPQQGVAYAATPELLEPRPVDIPAHDLLLELAALASTRPEAAPVNIVEYSSWSAQLDVGPDGPTQFIQPQDVRTEWRDDLSGSIVVVAGEAYPARGAHGFHDSAPEPPGTVLSEESFLPGQYPLLFRSEPPTTAAEMRSYLLQASDVTGDEVSAADLYRAIQGLLTQRLPTPAQESSILEVLAEQPDITVAGDVTDRDGRPGIAFRASSTNGQVELEYLLVVSPDGQILSLETIYQGGDSAFALPVPAVLEYTIWRRNES